MITLRNFVKEDALTLQKSYSHLSVEQTENLICEWNQKRFNDRYFEMFAVLFGEDIVGNISLYQHSSEVISIGPEIFEPYRRRGFAKESLALACNIAKENGYKIVSQQILTTNAASIALHLSLGFETNGYVYTNAKGNQVSIYLKCLV
ncbi:MAG: GNAT family N-acetyltransferase [Oscillospiraceae bacterium]|nr:GNAT family N-acetyltransferase [Oscillospiraceae bacterium]